MNHEELMDEDTPKHSKVLTMQMKEMDLKDALRLFSIYAFKMDYPPVDNLDLSVMGQLPLALEIIGSQLCVLTLERLSLRDCHMLREVNRSIGKLTRLKHLNLKGCTGLQVLPGEVGSLEAVDEIFLNGGHHNFTSLPESIGNLKSLLIFEVVNAYICQPPESIGRPRKVKRLSLKWCHRISLLPDMPGGTKSLVELDLSHTGITELPNSLGDLKKLEKLFLVACKIKKLPESLGCLRSLINLDMSLSVQLIKLPDSIGNLEELKVTKMDSCRVEKLPRSIGTMKKLKESNANCSELEGETPAEIGMLSCMRILELSYTKICLLPSTISQLPSLQSLKLRECNALGELPRLPTRTTTESKLSRPESLDPRRMMRQEWAMKRRIDRMMDLRKLEILALCIDNVTSLPAEFSTLSQLKDLALLGLYLRCVPQISSCLLRLKFVSLYGIIKLPRISTLKQLREFVFSQCSLQEDGFESLGVGEIEKLEHLEAVNDLTKLHGLSLPMSLKVLYVTGCKNVKKLPDLSHLKKLRVLCIKDCKELTEIPDLAELEPSPKVSISSCDSLRIMPRTSNGIED
ncbi:hypothetical protein CRG98_006714 [Punica granatum]|uniref:Disease resistance R13L4/SHOC-2-like LRR domain-containing protein n=2 Tax=Punica granatum TaxID=22663 RepID=A0A2I0KWS2_PUNGR|nr:hypothetical protein CRG98_006714 [Punica granatum]